MDKLFEIFSYILLGMLVISISYLSFMLNKNIKGDYNKSKE